VYVREREREKVGRERGGRDTSTHFVLKLFRKI
jgi:hypothetical protein